jgi:hypothetical protein
MKNKEQLLFCMQVQIGNLIRTKNHGRRTAFEFEPNLLEVQTCLETSDNFPKIPICLDLPYCEFIMAWLYGKI